MTHLVIDDVEAVARLYHGASAARWAGIQADGWLRRAPFGDQCVSLTDTPEVARYFADLAADADSSSPVILSVDPAGLDAEPFSSGVWGEGACDWERETACWQDVPLSAVREHLLAEPGEGEGR